jgi:hypothetical protein
MSPAPIIAVLPSSGSFVAELRELLDREHIIERPIDMSELQSLVERLLGAEQVMKLNKQLTVLETHPATESADTEYRSAVPSPLSEFPPRQTPFLVIIPAHNEQDSIGQVVRGVNEHFPLADVVVIDDGSLDETAEVASEAGAEVIELPFNLGIGGAVRAGLKLAHLRGYAYTIRVDADGQHDSRQIEDLLLVAIQGGYNAVIGSRFVDGGSEYRPPLARRIGIRLFSFIVSVIIGRRIYDTTSGMVALDRAAVRVLARNLPQDYPEVESHIILHRAGLSSVEVPVDMQVRYSGVSSIGAARAVYYVFKVSLAAVLRSLRPKSSAGEEV